MLLISYTLGTINPAYHIFSFERAMNAIDMNGISVLTAHAWLLIFRPR